MSKEIEWIVQTGDARLDKLVAEELPELTRSAVQNLISQGLVFCNGEPVLKSARPVRGDRITVRIPEPKVLDVEAENIPLEIVYEDADLLVVNKPKGMVVHPAPGHNGGTLVNALLYHCGNSLSGINGVMRPGIVHRIDKDTSGLLIVAKNDFAHQKLALQIQEHTFTREYPGRTGNGRRRNRPSPHRTKKNGCDAPLNCWQQKCGDTFLCGPQVRRVYTASAKA